MTLEDLYRLLRAGHVQAQGVMDTIGQPLLVLDTSLCVIAANPAFLRAFRVGRDETIGESLTRLGNGQWDIPPLTRLLQNVIPKSAAVIGYEVTHEFPELGQRTMLVTARRLSHPDNNSVNMLVVFDDVTETRRSAATRDLVLAEVEHRLKNFFGLVSALARQIPAVGSAAARYRDQFLDRLEVLTNAELGLFSEDGNELGYLIRTVLAPYEEHVTLQAGPAAHLRQQHVRPLSMVLHELGTNALKYGALSAPSGQLQVGWHRKQDRLVIEWRETGGPVVPPDHVEGFGTSLIRSLVEGALAGTITTRFEPGGLVAEIAIPADPGGTGSSDAT